MSWKALSWAEDVKTGSPIRKSVLIMLANHADESHSCFPKVKTISAATEISVSAVSEAIKNLVADGWIKTLERYDAKGARIHNRYLLMVDGPDTPLPPYDDYVGEQEYLPPRPPKGAAGDDGDSDGAEDDEYEDRPEPDGRPVPAGVDGWPVSMDSAETQPLEAPLRQTEGGASGSKRGGPPSAGGGALREQEGPPPADGGPPSGNRRASIRKEPSVNPLEQPPDDPKDNPPPPPVAHPGSDGATREEEENSIMTTALHTAAKGILRTVTATVPEHRLPGPAERVALVELAAAALRAGWTPDTLTRRLKSGNLADNHSGVFAVLRYRLTELPPAPGTAPPAPSRTLRTWCGDVACDPQTRQLLDPNGRPLYGRDTGGQRFPRMCTACGGTA